MSIADQKLAARRPQRDDLTDRESGQRRLGWPPLKSALGKILRECPAWLRSSCAASILAVEVMFFTLLFEFKMGPMQIVANSIVLTGLVVGAIGFAMISGLRRQPLILPPLDRSRSNALVWGAVHLVVVCGFYYLTKVLQSSVSDDAAGWGTSLFWAATAGAVAASCWMAALPWSWMRAFLRQSIAALCGGAVVAALMILLTPTIRQLWLTTDGPALEIVRGLLEWFPGFASIRFHGVDRPVPIVGTSNISLVVTQYCSEMESLLAFALLGVLLLVAGGRRMWSFYFLAPFLIGFELLYFFNAMRLYLLLLMGHIMADTSWAQYSGRACVSLAHSRVGSFLLLAAAVLILLVGERLSRREWQTPDAAGRAD